MNYLVAPILYKGSCFNDIVSGLLYSAKNLGVEFTSMPFVYGELNRFGLENPNEYIKHSLEKIDFLRRNLKNGDKLLMVDFFFPGMDLLEFFLQRKNIKVFKVALVHGGTFVSGDLYGTFNWLYNFESGWLDIFDLLICPSKFFVKNLPRKYMGKVKIYPWGLNMDINKVTNEKSIDVVFPHRFAYDKGVFDLFKIIKRMPHVNFVLTGLSNNVIIDLPRDLKVVFLALKKMANVKILPMESESQHRKTLKSSKIVLSTARQEGFGYSVFKSIQCGAIPVLPNRCCYPEFFPKKYLYNSLEDAIFLIDKFIKRFPLDYYDIDNKKFNFDKIIKHFK